MAKTVDEKKVAVVGAGGHARSLIALANNCGYQCTGIYDNKPSCEACILNIPTKGKVSEIPKGLPAILAIGDNQIRKALYESNLCKPLNDNLIHDSSIIESSVTLGKANQCFARCYLNAEVMVGDDNIINTGAILEHETVVGNHNHIAVGAVLLGRVTLGDNCMIGSCAVIQDGISICNNVVIGANSFVNKNISEAGVYVGSPIRKIK